MDGKECPMCGELMDLRPRTVVDRIPGTTASKLTEYQEWTCPGCDYFEERREDEETAG